MLLRIVRAAVHAFSQVREWQIWSIALQVGSSSLGHSLRPLLVSRAVFELQYGSTYVDAMWALRCGQVWHVQSLACLLERKRSPQMHSRAH
eukprot:7078966-Alexandrium_andersonii.AAC.1